MTDGGSRLWVSLLVESRAGSGQGPLFDHAHCWEFCNLVITRHIRLQAWIQKLFSGPPQQPTLEHWADLSVTWALSLMAWERPQQKVSFPRTEAGRGRKGPAFKVNTHPHQQGRRHQM